MSPTFVDYPVVEPDADAPDVLRCASMELVVTDLERSRNFYVDVLGLVVTEEDENTIYLRSIEEFIHHNLILRKGETAAVAAFSYRVRTPEDLDKAEKFYSARGCQVRRNKDGFVKGLGDSVRVQDPLGFPYEFFYDVEHVERLAWRYDLHTPAHSSAWTTSTRSPPTSPPPSNTWKTSASASPKTSKTKLAPPTPPGCAASPPSTTPP